MAETAFCDQCGRELSEEDFEEGRAIRDRADVFCAECAKMYAKDEERSRKEQRTAEAAARISATASARTRTIRGAASRRRTTTRAAPGGRRRASAPQQSNVFTFYIVAGVVALISLIVILAVAMRGDKEPPPQPQPQPHGTAPAPPGPDPSTSPTVPPGGAPRPTRRPSGREEPPVGRSLFGPGGEMERGPR